MKDLISGYIRITIKLDSIVYTDTADVHYLCLIFYIINEKFINPDPLMQILSSSDDYNKSDIISTNKDKLQNYVDPNDNRIACKLCKVVGDIIIDTKSNPNIIAIWTLKINSKAMCQIGIDSVGIITKSKYGFLPTYSKRDTDPYDDINKNSYYYE